VVRDGYGGSIGSKLNIPLWEPNMLGDGTTLMKPHNLHPHLGYLLISDILMNNRKIWNVGLLHALLEPNQVVKVLSTPILDSVIHDKGTWKYEKNGIYEVKRGYREIMQNHSTHISITNRV